MSFTDGFRPIGERPGTERDESSCDRVYEMSINKVQKKKISRLNITRTARGRSFKNEPTHFFPGPVWREIGVSGCAHVANKRDELLFCRCVVM